MGRQWLQFHKLIHLTSRHLKNIYICRSNIDMENIETFTKDRLFMQKMPVVSIQSQYKSQYPKVFIVICSNMFKRCSKVICSNWLFCEDFSTLHGYERVIFRDMIGNDTTKKRFSYWSTKNITSLPYLVPKQQDFSSTFLFHFSIRLCHFQFKFVLGFV